MILLSSSKAEQAIVDGSLQPWEKVKAFRVDRDPPVNNSFC